MSEIHVKHLEYGRYTVCATRIIVVVFIIVIKCKYRFSLWLV